MESIVIIQCYDPAITKAPFKFIELERFKAFIRPSTKDDLGVNTASDLTYECIKRGYQFQFYTIYINEDKKLIYEAVVYNQGSPGSCIFDKKHYPLKVKCISNETYERYLDIGKEYDLIADLTNTHGLEVYHVQLKESHSGQFPKYLFKLITN